MGRPWYVTREDVMSALDTKESARAARQIDRAIASACDSVDGQLKRVFYPTIETRTFDWPAPTQIGTRPWRYWLDDNELVSASALSSGSTTIAASDYFLRPDTGPPYTYIELDLAANSAFNATSTWQRSISITGTWMGCAPITEDAGAVSGAIGAADTTMVVTDSAAVGTGAILIAGTEYMIVTRRSMVDTTQDTTGALTASKADVTVGVGSGAAFSVDETILINSERMQIVDIAGNSLTVIRATDGSVLAAHNTAQDVYAPRSCTVERGALGSTATSHADTLALTRHVPPPLVSELSLAETVVGMAQKGAAYARSISAGENIREVTGRGLTDLRAQAYQAYGRKVRHRAV